MNHLKHLPKIRKRDSVIDSKVFYRAIVNDSVTDFFNTKAEMIAFIAKYYSEKPISSLNMQKITLQSLNS